MAFSDAFNLSSKTYLNHITFFMFNISFTNIKRVGDIRNKKDEDYEKIR
jgi:hypothetical protein